MHDGTWSSFRGRDHGRPATGIPGSRFVTYLQDHDQVGNRAVGDRSAQQLSPGMLRIGAALLLTSPYVPMLFMGEEWGARTPWQFFTDHEPELGRLVREGRRAEFTRHGWAADDVPDPQDPETFRRSVLDWQEREHEEHADLLDWHQESDPAAAADTRDCMARAKWCAASTTSSSSGSRCIEAGSRWRATCPRIDSKCRWPVRRTGCCWPRAPVSPSPMGASCWTGRAWRSSACCRADGLERSTVRQIGRSAPAGLAPRRLRVVSDTNQRRQPAATRACPKPPTGCVRHNP